MACAEKMIRKILKSLHQPKKNSHKGQNGKLLTAIGSEVPIVARMAKVGKGDDPNCLLEDIVPQVGPGNGWENAIHYFIDCVEKKERPFVSGEEGKETIKVIIAAYESAKVGRWVKV